MQCISVVSQLTSTSDKDLSVTAGEAVQQRLGSDVVVQKRSRAAQLGQCQPHPHKLRLIAQEQSHRVPWLQVGMRGQSSGHFVAFSVGLAVSVRAVLEKNELLMRLLLRLVQETIQNTVKRFLLLESVDAYTNFNGSNSVT